MRRAMFLTVPLLLCACDAPSSEPAEVSSETVPDETPSVGKLRLRDQTIELRSGYLGEYRGDEPLDEAQAGTDHTPIMADTDHRVMEPPAEAPAL